jgi:hypothetical protein
MRYLDKTKIESYTIALRNKSSLTGLGNYSNEILEGLNILNTTIGEEVTYYNKPNINFTTISGLKYQMFFDSEILMDDFITTNLTPLNFLAI